MPTGELAVGHHALERRRQLEEAQRVGHRDPALAHPGRRLLVGEVELLDQLLVGRRLLHGVQVGAVEVLDDGLLEGRAPRPALRMMAGMASSPARRAARQRRSPAISS